MHTGEEEGRCTPSKDFEKSGNRNEIKNRNRGPQVPPVKRN
jgi:hypothetical protein